MLSSSSQQITISSIPFIHPTTLAPILLNSPSSIAIIDVRDSDHVGGHIKSSLWIPTQQLTARIPELLRTLQSKEKVIFHCMLSQQRGPRAALEYLRAKRGQEDKEKEEKEEEEGKGKKQQEVMVLEGGFEGWQSRYGDDERLTEGWVRDIWE